MHVVIFPRRQNNFGEIYMRSVRQSFITSWTTLSVFLLLLFSSSSVMAAPPVWDQGCVLDQDTAPGGLNCTANDTTLSSPTIIIVEACDFPGDTAVLNLTVDITVGAQTRYDLGVWIATDGDPNADGAATGECAALSVANNLIHVDQITPTFGDGDLCGDIFNVDPAPPVPPTETAHLLFADLGTFPVPCEDSDGDGKIDVPVIIAWKQQANPDCSVSNAAVPGTASKCVEDLTFQLDIPIPGQILVDKVTVPADATIFGFLLTGPDSGLEGGFSGSEAFALSDASPAFDTAIFTGGVPAGVYAVSEDVTPGYVTEVSCTGSEGAEDPAAIDVAPGEVVNCVFTNTLDSATINVVKNTVGGNGEFTFNWIGPTTAGGVVLITTETGTFLLTEFVIPPGWVLGNAACVDDNGGGSVGTWDNIDTISDIDLSPGDSVTCTFTNQVVGTVMLAKNTNGGDGSFDYVTNVPGLGTNIQTSGGSGNATPATNVPTGTYSIVETVPADWNLDSATCSNGSPPDALVLTLNETVTCTFTNTKLGTIIVEKQTLPDGSPEIFEFTGNVAGLIADGGQISLSGLLPATYNSTETPVDGWTLTSIVCDDGESDTPSSGDTDTGTATFNLDAGETVTCVFTNTQDGTIEVIKSMPIAGPESETFNFTSNFNGDFFLIGDAATTGPVPVAPGSGYTVSEDDPSLDGWANTGASCGDGSDPLSNIDVSPGEAVVCTFTNTPLGSVVVIKETIGGNDIFGFAGDIPIGVFSLDTTDQFTATTDDLFEYILAPGIYDVTEDSVPAGWTLTDISCNDDSNTNLGTATASMDVQLAETVVCTFTNTLDSATINVVKNTVGGNGEFTFNWIGPTTAGGVVLD